MKILLALFPALLMAQSGLTPPPKVQFFNDDGTPMSGGKLCTYQAGTSTPLNTFTDSALTIPHQNPIILDTRGEATIWLSTAASYRFILRRPGGVTTPLVTACSDTPQVWSVDNIVTGGSGGGGGGSLPVDDTTAVVRNAIDNTKQVRISAAALSPLATRVMTIPDANFTVAGTDIAQTFTQTQTFNANIVPNIAGFHNVGTVALPFSTAHFVQYLARFPSGLCNYAGMTGSVAGGTVFAQDGACATQAQMSANGFDTVNTVGSYRVQGTTVVNPSRHLENIAGVATNLIPTAPGVRDLGGTGFQFRETHTNVLYGDSIVPITPGGLVGTIGLPFGSGVFDTFRILSSFRYKSTSTAGWVLTATDALGNADWAAPPSGTLPSQTGNAGRFLTTDGTNASWAVVSGAGISSLNAQTGATQTFANDTNVTISSASNVHTLGWTGQLAASRGGTGLSAFSRTGNTTEFATWTGAKTSGRCVEIDASGNLVQSSGGCSGGGGGGGLTSLNGLSTTTWPSQTFSTGTSGSDFNISSAGGVHFWNIPSASASARGLVTTTEQVFGGLKRFTDGIDPDVTGVGSVGRSGRRWASVFANSLTITDTAGFGVSGNLVPAVTATWNLGSSTQRWNSFFGKDNFLYAPSGGLARNVLFNSSLFARAEMYADDINGGGLYVNNSGGSEYFGAFNGQVRYNALSGITGTVVIGGCTLTFNQGGLTGRSGC